eukprot:166027-Prymnesium_polylepis.2
MERERSGEVLLARVRCNGPEHQVLVDHVLRAVPARVALAMLVRVQFGGAREARFNMLTEPGWGALYSGMSERPAS